MLKVFVGTGLHFIQKSLDKISKNDFTGKELYGIYR